VDKSGKRVILVFTKDFAPVTIDAATQQIPITLKKVIPLDPGPGNTFQEIPIPMLVRGSKYLANLICILDEPLTTGDEFVISYDPVVSQLVSADG
jgi:hypothetical protein